MLAKSGTIAHYVIVALMHRRVASEDTPWLKDIHAATQLILDLAQLCQTLLHLLVQLHAAACVKEEPSTHVLVA